MKGKERESERDKERERDYVNIVCMFRRMRKMEEGKKERSIS